MAKKQDRIIMYLACTECKERNYTSSKNKRNDPARMELNKFCPRCRLHRLHRETK
ncbi:MAG TPA: 50S ribosomal protein L33 [Chloroflexia bacterium]|jgi:large subunit ribosomal protein L33|nr:50S ribosomal protein L33 [Chloroflexia bacterium]